MSFLAISYTSCIIPLLAILGLGATYHYLTQRKQPFTVTSAVRNHASKDRLNAKPTSSSVKSLEWYQAMFFKLQNLEDHPNVLEPARNELLAMFSRALSLAQEYPKASILPIENYDAESVWAFIEAQHSRVMTEWEAYLERRKRGYGPELIPTVDEAKQWLVKQAPIKFVDGAWLGHIHKITTPFSLRGVTKDAWQVMSEELGDGDLSKHHVHLYRQLLDDIGCQLPEGHEADFINSCHWKGFNNRDAWEAAVGQLLISLFPNEFLPEILGFNMHYELITMGTMLAAHELKALGINPYYFLIHIAIDNADSGHTAMATHVITRYLDMVRETEGDDAVRQAWRRVQVGYTLSQGLGNPKFCEYQAPASADIGSIYGVPKPAVSLLGTRVIDIFRTKSLFSHQFHCQSRVRIGDHTLAQWLAPSMWDDPHSGRDLELLTALARAKPWVIPGASNKSLLVRELSWGGRMFSTFTHGEVSALTAWIDSLSPESDAHLYWGFTGREMLHSQAAVSELRDPTRHHPVVISCKTNLTDPLRLISSLQSPHANPQALVRKRRHVKPLSRACLADIVAYWFADISLLENTINTPSRTASPLYANVMRVMRAQLGFALETHIVAGMDEIRGIASQSLIDFGVEIIFRAGWTPSTQPACLQDVLDIVGKQGLTSESARLVKEMLRWSTRPNANLGLLLGLSLAFLELKEAVVKDDSLLGEKSRLVLEAIVARERQSLEECLPQLKGSSEAQYQQLIQGYQIGVDALGTCLQEKETSSSGYQ